MNNLTAWYCHDTVREWDGSFFPTNHSEFDIQNDLFESQDGSVDQKALREAFRDCFFSYQEWSYDLPLWQKILWSFAFVAMLFVAISGNFIIIWVVLYDVIGNRRMRTLMNYFVISLSVADLMMSSLNGVSNLSLLLISYWQFEVMYCIINNFVVHLTVAANVFTLTFICYDRYMAIMKPIKHHTVSHKKSLVFIFLIWFASLILAIPSLLYSTVKSARYLRKTRILCYIQWLGSSYLDSRMEYYYNILFLSVTYLIPMMTMIICYTIMGRKLWNSKSIGEQTDSQNKSIQSKRKVVKMFIVIVATFAICWLPYQTFFIFIYHYGYLRQNILYTEHVYLGFYWLAMSNAMINPIIYYVMNSRFRVYFQQIRCNTKKILGKFRRSSAISCNSGRLQATSMRDMEMKMLNLHTRPINDDQQNTTAV